MPAEPEASFDAWVRANYKYIQFVQALLQTELTDNPVQVEKAGREAESHYGRMTSLEAWAKSYVSIETFRALPAREKGKTDLERRAELDANIARVDRVHLLVKGLVKALEIRVSFSQSLLKTYSQEGRRTRMTP